MTQKSNSSMDLTTLVAELTTREKAKHDYVLPSEKIVLSDDLKLTVLDKTLDGLEFIANEIMHQHFAAKLAIPANYYRRLMNEYPDLLAINVNKLMQAEKGKPVLLRTFQHEATGNIARGLLSDRYSIVDNYDVLFAALSAIKQSNIKVDVKECNITDKRMYVHIVAPEIEVQSEVALRGYLSDKSVERGYGIITGLCLTNSEVGYGSYNIFGRIFEKICMNGAIIKDDAFRKVHLGGRMEQGSVTFSNATKQKNIELIMSQTGDVIKQFLSEGWLTGVVQKIERAKGIELDQPVDTLNNVIREVAKEVTLTEENRQNILNFFVKDGDTSASGVFQALTRESQNLDADNRFELESLAFELLPKIKSFDYEFKMGKN